MRRQISSFSPSPRGQTRNPFYSEFAADRAREYERLHNGILQQLIEMDMEPVSGHIASIPPVLHDEEEPEADLVRKVLEERRP